MRRYRHVVLLLGVLAVLLAGAGCDGPPPAPGPTWLPEDAPSAIISSEATRLYRDFPVTAKPRPIVLTRAALADVDHPGDFNVNTVPGITQKYAVTGALPKTPAKPVTVRLPDGDTQVRLADYEVMCRWDDDGGCPDTGVGPRATVTLASAWFATDRGLLELPAWVLTPEDAANDTLAIPALPPAMFYGGDGMYAPPRPQGSVWAPATISADGLTLHVQVTDTRDVCSGQPNPPIPVVVEDGGAVAVAGRKDRRMVGKRSRCATVAMETFIEIEVRLDRPLGNRVLVDHDGAVFPVLPA